MTARALNLAARQSAAPCVAYTRVSKEDQARDEKASLRQQREAVEALAARLGVTLGQVFTDPGRSGGNADRPAFQALIDYCERNKQPKSRPGLVLVLNDSRWGRFDNPEEETYWRIYLEKRGWDVRFAEGDAEDRRSRRMNRFMNSETASEYREHIKRNAKAGARGNAEQGFWSNREPLGYRRVTVGGSRPGTVLNVGQRKTDDEHVKLTLGPESERRVVRFMFEEYGGGMSMGALVRELRRRWPGLRKWSNGVVRQMLMNPAQCGDTVWMRRSNGPRDGDVVVMADTHPALVERSLWGRVQARLKANRKETRPTAGGYPLRGLISCSECGAPYVGSGGPRGPDNEPDRYRFYREQVSDKKCGHRQGTLQKRMVEPLVIAEVAKVVGHPKVQRLVAEALDRLLGAVPDTRRALDTERTQLIAKRKRVVDAVSDGAISPTDAKATLTELNASIEALAAEGERMRFTVQNRKALAAERERLLGMAKDFTARVRHVSGSALRDLLQPWLAGATFDKKARTITLTIRQVPFTNSLSSRGRGSL